MEKNRDDVATIMSLSGVYMGVVLWVVVQGQPMSIRTRGCCKMLLLETWYDAKNNYTYESTHKDGKLEIWQLVINITIWYILKAKCIKVFQNMTERHA